MRRAVLLLLCLLPILANASGLLEVLPGTGSNSRMKARNITFVIIISETTFIFPGLVNGQSVLILGIMPQRLGELQSEGYQDLQSYGKYKS
jgi:hypothetical protein